MTAFRRGANRVVLVCHLIAVKFARHKRGRYCNRFEAETFERSMGRRREGLCPVLWCSKNGAVLVMRSATPLTEEEFKMLPDDALPDWEHRPGEAGAPIEYKAERTLVG
jgi:hypothetical protein